MSPARKRRKHVTSRQTAPKPAAPAAGRGRVWLYGLMAGGLVLAALLLMWRSGPADAVPDGPGVPVRINMGGFSPAVIEARAGEPVTIRLINEDNRFHSDGGGKHNFIIESLGVSELVQPEKTLTFTFTPDQAGEYDFYCDICCGGKENPAMHGRLVVT